MESTDFIRSIVFFRIRLLKSNPEETQEILQDMSIASKAIIKEMAEICWYMRGSITWDQAWQLTSKQKQVIRKVINANIERTEKLGMPLL